MSDTKKPSDPATTDDAGKELSEDQLENVAGGRNSGGQPMSKAVYDWITDGGSTPPKK